MRDKRVVELVRGEAKRHRAMALVQGEDLARDQREVAKALEIAARIAERKWQDEVRRRGAGAAQRDG